MAAKVHDASRFVFALAFCLRFSLMSGASLIHHSSLIIHQCSPRPSRRVLRSGCWISDSRQATLDGQKSNLHLASAFELHRETFVVGFDCGKQSEASALPIQKEKRPRARLPKQGVGTAH